MPPSMTQRAARWKSERGVTLPIIALSLVAILSFAALSIDLGTLYEAKAEAQRAADAAALAAAQVISAEGVTSDPTGGALDGIWAQICGGPGSFASLAATNVAKQNLIGGAPATQVNTYYGTAAGGVTNPACTGAGAGFGINPVVSVYVQQANLPNFFSRVFSFITNGTPSNSGVSATAFAEAFNPSNSGTYGTGGNVIPVQPRCVKPWIVPNQDPRHPISCNSSSCVQFVNPTTGQIVTPGTFANNGVIGERFFLQPDCSGTGTTCNPLPNNPPNATPPILQYVPGQTLNASIAIPANGPSPTCASVTSLYAQAIAGCDQSTVYQCGVAMGNVVDLGENPSFTASADTQNGVQCLINQTTQSTANPSGQDVLAPGGQAPPSYPFQIQAGSSSPLVIAGIVIGGNNITNSASIVSLPIYDTVPINTSGTTNITVVGFLQVFINAVDTVNGIDVTVLNISGCGNSTSNPPVFGTSSVPVRLIAPPVPAS
jgi:hypothetical protein